ncbi:molybdenum cofactor guanylyltransferase [Natrialbaceae archaeon A-gly3]
MRTGVIVAGGQSTRFGEADKAVAELAGTPMIRRVGDRLETVVDALVVNCRDDQRAAIEAAMAGYSLPVTFAIDEEPDLGPMAGIYTGLRAVESEYAAVVACDMPFIDPNFLEYLFSRATGADAALARLEDGWFQTTQAVYRADAMADACKSALERGDRRILDPLEDLEYVVVSEAEVREVTTLETFRNLNTAEEFERAGTEFARGQSLEETNG